MRCFACVVVLVALAALQACDGERAATTREVKALLGEDFPFLFTLKAYAAQRQTRRVLDGQMLEVEGTVSFIREDGSRPVSANQLDELLMRAARRHGFRETTSEQPLRGAPSAPPSDQGWTEQTGVRSRSLWRYRAKDDGWFECRVWIAPDGSRFAVWYFVVY